MFQMRIVQIYSFIIRTCKIETFCCSGVGWLEKRDPDAVVRVKCLSTAKAPASEIACNLKLNCTHRKFTQKLKLFFGNE